MTLGRKKRRHPARGQVRRKLPGWPTALVVTVVASALVPAPRLLDGATGAEVPFATLVQPGTYLIAAPLFGLWDTLSLLTLHQHFAVLGTLVVLYGLVRLKAPRSRLRIPGRAGMEIVRAVGAVVLLVGFYGAALLLPRPMVGLSLSDPDLLSIDFHSHTNYSHDGWSLFTALRNRGWHEDGGFDVGYITDHYTWRGVDEAVLDNPRLVGARTVLLSGAEMRLRRRHINVLGDRTRYAFALDSTEHHLDPDSINQAHHRGVPAPTMLYTIPGPLDQIVPLTDGTAAGVVGVELNDGAPRGLEQAKGERRRIVSLADSMNLALVAGANLHGWGRTVAAWSVMRIPGWQDMTPLEVGDAIESGLHRDRRLAVTVVERRLPFHGGSRAKLALTVPWLLWEQMRMLTFWERISWLCWTVAFALTAAVRRRTHLGALFQAGSRSA